MPFQEFPNWIAGRPAAALGGQWFDVPRRAGLARAARSTAADWRAAHAAALAARERWSRLGSRARRERLGPAVRALLGLDSAAAVLGEALGLEPGERCPALAPSREGLERALEPFGAGLGPGGAGLEAGAPRLVLAHWREGLGALAERVLAALAEGSPVIALTDRYLPEAGEALAAALAEADLPPGIFALLCDDGRTVLRAARTEAELEIEALHGDERAEPDPAGPAQARPIALRRAGQRTFLVRAADDAVEAAGRLLELAFGRSQTLSGQLPGHVGRVLCHERRLSAFTGALLCEYDRACSAPPLPLVDPASERSLHAAWALGLDEGACG